MRYNKQRFGILFAFLLSGLLIALGIVVSFGVAGAERFAYADEETEIEEHEHEFEHDFTLDVKPSCTEEGSMSRHCSRCEEKTEITPVAKLSHLEKIDPAEEPTCTESGKTEGKHCSVCGTVLQAQETIKALGHDYGEWTVTKEATTEEVGEKERVCSRDETHVDVREIPKVQSYGGFLVIFALILVVAAIVVGVFVSFIFHEDWRKRRR